MHALACLAARCSLGPLTSTPLTTTCPPCLPATCPPPHAHPCHLPAGNPELSEITSAVVAAAATAARASAIHSSTQLPPPVPEAAAAAAAAPAQPAAPGDGAILSDDCMEEMEMLQQQVDLLARHSSASAQITPPLLGQQQQGIGPSGLGPRVGSLQDMAAARASAGGEGPQGEGADSDDVRETAAMATIIASGVLPAALHLDGGSSSGEDEAANVVMMMASGEEEEAEEEEGAERVEEEAE